MACPSYRISSVKIADACHPIKVVARAGLYQGTGVACKELQNPLILDTLLTEDEGDGYAEREQRELCWLAKAAEAASVSTALAAHST